MFKHAQLGILLYIVLHPFPTHPNLFTMKHILSESEHFASTEMPSYYNTHLYQLEAPLWQQKTLTCCTNSYHSYQGNRDTGEYPGYCLPYVPLF